MNSKFYNYLYHYRTFKFINWLGITFSQSQSYKNKIKENKDMTHIWNKILDSYSKNPRDILTFGKRKYFYVYTEKDDIYIESGREHINSSKITVRRKLDKENLEFIYSKYKAGSKPSEVLDITYNSVYWFGIFYDLKL